MGKAQNTNGIEAIVLNAFSQYFVIGRELFEVIFQMESFIEDGQADDHDNADMLPLGQESVYLGDNWEMQMNVGKMDIFRYALYENNIPVIRDITIINKTNDLCCERTYS